MRAFYFGVADRLRRARLRSIGRQAFREENNVKALETAQSEAPAPYQRMVDAETARREILVARPLKLVLDRAFKLLKPRQRRALEYYCLKPGYGWAESLAKEVGGTARAWRKAKSEAISKVLPFLESHGVRFSREEGRFEVA